MQMPLGTSNAVKEPVVQLRDLKKSFGSNHVLRGVDLDLERGKNLVVIGRSGCGKSILAKCIIGLVRPDSGSVKVFGEETMGWGRQELNNLRTRIGFLFQSNALYDSMNIYENLIFTLQRREREMSKQEMKIRVDEVLENVGLPNVALMMPSELSGGMKKRIGLARALVLKPELMLYDEPTTGLDPITSREISNLMMDMQNRYNISSIIISHDLQCVRLTANKIMALIDGVSYASGTYNELESSSDPRVSSFFL